MQYRVRFHPEITIKSKSVRKRFGKVLCGNLRTMLKSQVPDIHITFRWDHISITCPQSSAAQQEVVLRRLQDTPGIAFIEDIVQTDWQGFDETLEWVLATQYDQLVDRRFAVRVKRKGQHDFSSQELAVYLGGGINQRVPGTRVDLSQPEHEVQLGLNQDQLTLVQHRYPGLGGMPLPTQDSVLSLMSGGFDSAVASFQMIRRGARTHFLFFNLGADEHETAVREIAYYLWERYSRSHAVQFISVDFSPVVERILEEVDNGLMGVMLKRCMYRAAAQVAAQVKARAIVTGEAIGQVSSQTLANLQLIDEVTETLVLRPLIVADKPDIVAQARAIGVEPLSAVVPEYCGVISQRPTVRAEPQAVRVAEQVIPETLINEVVQQAYWLDIRQVHTDQAYNPKAVREFDQVPEGARIIDVRTRDEVEERPLAVRGVQVEHVPFFKLPGKLAELPKDNLYVLYCEQGIMSRLQAVNMREEGFAQVGVLKPAEDN